MTAGIPRAPGNLSAEARRFWRAVMAVHVLEPHHERILHVACEALDRMREAQAAVAKDGSYVDGRFGPKAHPGLAIERDSRLAMLRAIRELGLDLVPAASRPPTRWQ